MLGYRIGGRRTGPNALVAGHAAMMCPIVDRLERIESLSWLRGTLFVVMLDRLDGLSDPGDLAALLGARGPMDGQLTLSALPRVKSQREEDARHIRNGYRSVLQLCTRLGMISGRGVTGR